MKKILIMFCFAVFALTACKKDADVLVKEGTFNGKWELVKTTGTITGNGISTDWKIIEFDGKNAYFYGDDNIKMDWAIITLDETKKTILFAFPDNVYRIIDLRGDPNKNYEFEGDSVLYLNSDCCDRVNYELKKKQ
jgi:hypothetical protein